MATDVTESTPLVSVYLPYMVRSHGQAIQCMIWLNVLCEMLPETAKAFQSITKSEIVTVHPTLLHDGKELNLGPENKWHMYLMWRAPSFPPCNSRRITTAWKLTTMVPHW